LFLQEIAEEFSHTVMHGVKLQKAVMPGAASPVVNRPLPPKPPAGLSLFDARLLRFTHESVVRLIDADDCLVSECY
jgi:hypothetical protein